MRGVQFSLFSLGFASINAAAWPQLNLTQGVSSISHDIFNLHMMVIWICVGIGAVVFGTIAYSIIFHRQSKGAKPAQFHEHLWLEIAWTLVPFILITGMAIPGTLVLRHLNIPDKPELTIKITGYQWKWRYEYLNEGVSFFSNISTPYSQINGTEPKGEHYLREVDKPLVLPIHKNIRFLLTSNDVIHAWWVPDLGVKKDSVPGFINQAWTRIERPGTYRGQCAELCGLNHALMPIVVNAVSEAEFKKWLAAQTAKPSLANVTSEVTKKPITPSAPIPTVTQPNTTTPTAPASTTIAAILQAAEAAANAAKATADAAKAVSPTSPATKAAEAAAEAAEDTAKAAEAASLGLQTPTPTTSPPKPPLPTPTTAPQPSTINNTTQPAPATTPPAPQATPSSSGQNLSKDDLMKKGEQVFQGTCATCHQPDGAGMPPVYPALKADVVVKGPLENHIHTVLFGRPGTAMQAFKDQFSDEELAAVITYERNAFGNNTGDIVQPSQITAAKAKGP